MKLDDLVGAAVVHAVDDPGQQMRQPDEAVFTDLPEQVLFLGNKRLRKIRSFVEYPKLTW